MDLRDKLDTSINAIKEEKATSKGIQNELKFMKQYLSDITDLDDAKDLHDKTEALLNDTSMVEDDFKAAARTLVEDLRTSLSKK